MTTVKPIYMTPACAQQMRAELKELLYVKRPDTVRRVADAAAEGDRSENAEYIYGKRHLRKIDSRIHFLTKRIENAQIIDPVKQGETAAGRVLFGASVSVEDEDRECPVKHALAVVAGGLREVADLAVVLVHQDQRLVVERYGVVRWSSGLSQSGPPSPGNRRPAWPG